MTIQFFNHWNGNDGIATLAPAEEARLVGLGIARYYTDGMDGQSGVPLMATELPGGGFEANVGGQAVELEGGLYVADSVDAATSNTAAINARLLAGDSVTVSVLGDVYINAPLVFSVDGAKLFTGGGTRIKKVPSSQFPVIKTSVQDAAGVSVTVAWTAGLLASVSWAGHSLEMGDAIVLQGATESNWLQVMRVISVTSPDVVVVQLRRPVAAAPVGTLLAWRCLRNIEVDADLDYNWDRVPAGGQTVDRHTAVMVGLADSKVRVVTRNAYKYGLLMCGWIDSEWECVGYDVSDIAKVYGPSVGVVGRVSGISVDDQFSYQSQEPAAFIAYQKFVGPIFDCETESRVTSGSSGASSASCVLYLDNNHKPDNITFSGQSASQLRGGFSIKPGDTFTGSLSLAGLVTVDNFTSAPKAAEFAFGVSATVDQLVFKRPVVVPGDGATQFFRLENTSTVKRLVVDDFNFQNTGWPAAATSFAFNLNGALDQGEFVGHRITGASAFYRHINIGTGGAVRQVVIRGGSYDGGNCIVFVPAGVTSNPTIVFDGARIRNFTNVLVALSACTVVLRNCQFDTVTAVIRGQTNPINIRLVDGGGNTFASAPLTQMLNSSTLTIYGQELPVTLNAVGVRSTVRGQFCTSATAVGTIPAGAPVVCDGTNWRALEDRSLFF